RRMQRRAIDHDRPAPGKENARHLWRGSRAKANTMTDTHHETRAQGPRQSPPHNPMWWYREFCSMLDDPVFHKMPDRTFKTLMMLRALARRFDGVLPPESELAFYLRRDVASDVQYLRDAGLLIDKGDHLEPVDWHLHQVASDVSTTRVRKF